MPVLSASKTFGIKKTTNNIEHLNKNEKFHQNLQDALHLQHPCPIDGAPTLPLLLEPA
jgi:hypothetical protein